jgi:predicted nucleic acid-binding protein
VSRVFLDTNFFIYLIQGTGVQAVRARHLLNAFSSRKDHIMTSVMTLGELLVQPLRLGDKLLVERYKRLLRGPGISVLPFLEVSAETFARIRVDKRVKPPDAIQLAVASTASCDLFLTNDERLMGLAVPGIQFITSFERAPL